MTSIDSTHDLKGKKGKERVIKAFSYSLAGLAAAYKREAAFRQLILLHSILICGALLIPFGLPIRLLLVTISFLSLIIELLNTAIEAVVDYISTDIHPLAKIAKDVGSAAQMLALILVGLIWSAVLAAYFFP